LRAWLDEQRIEFASGAGSDFAALEQFDGVSTLIRTCPILRSAASPLP